MITVRPAEERGHADLGWLKTRYSFSFSDYHDPAHMGFRTLRVINDDRIAGGGGFGAHPHRDMEIITYVLEGALEHRDSMGNGAVLRRGDIQHMTAGTGVVHSEFNNSPTDPAHLLQIWIFPEKRGLPPGYEDKHFGDDEKLNRLRLLASPDGADDSLILFQEASVYASILEKGKEVRHTLPAGRHAWIQVAKGDIVVNGKPLKEGDGGSISDESELAIVGASERAEFLLFELA